MTTFKDLAEDQVATYAVGVTSLSACAPAAMTIEQVTAAVNAQEPTGISTDWSPSPDEKFATGEPNPSPCNLDPDSRRHYLFQCLSLIGYPGR